MTTLPEEWGADEGPPFEPNVAEAEYPAVVPVRVVFSETENLPPGFASCMTWPIPVINVGTPLAILQRRQHRFKAQLMLSMPGAGTVTLNTKQEPLSVQQGFAFVATAAVSNQVLPPYESQQPLYVIASIAGCTIAVIDQSFGQVQ